MERQGTLGSLAPANMLLLSVEDIKCIRGFEPSSHGRGFLRLLVDNWFFYQSLSRTQYIQEYNNAKFFILSTHML
jgi:hypothetical protein